MKSWDQNLLVITQAVASPVWRRVAADARIGHAKQAQILIEVCGDLIDQEGQNLVRLLSAFDRIGLAREIHSQLMAQRDLSDGVVEIELTSALAETGDESKILARLRQHFGAQLRLVRKTDHSLIGGAVLRQGDRVLDASLKGGLERVGRHLRV